MALKKEMPEVYGNYLPHARADYTGELVDAFGIVTTPPSMTKQEFVAECDINNIIREYTMTGQINHISGKAAQGAYEDLPGPLDFQEAMNTVLDAQAAFSSLPSGVRNRFENDPQQFLAFCSDPANQAEMIKLGLATERPKTLAQDLGDILTRRPPGEPLPGPKGADQVPAPSIPPDR